MSSSEVQMRKGTHELSDSSHPLLLSSCPSLHLLRLPSSLRRKDMSYPSSLYQYTTMPLRFDDHLWHQWWMEQVRWRRGPECKCSNHEGKAREPRSNCDSALRARIKIDLFHIHWKRDKHPKLRLHTNSVTDTVTGSRHWITSSISMRCHLSTDNIQSKAEHSICWRNLIGTSIHHRLFPIFFLNFTN